MEKNDIDLGFMHEHFKEGTHMCLIYKDEEERKKIISQYLYRGLETGEKVSYFATQPDKEELISMLQEIGVVINEENLEVLNATDTYCPNKEFVPEEMLQTLRQFYDNTQKDGFKTCRVTGEMQWALQPIPGADRLMEYEALVNNVLKTHPVTAICQYDARKFSGETIIDCLKVHPFMIVNGQVIENPYYLTPEEFLAQR